MKQHHASTHLWQECLDGRGTLCGFQQTQRGANYRHLLFTIMRKPKWTSHQVWRNQCARWLEQLRIRAEGLDVDTHGWDANCLDCARDVTHGHMTDGSARGQKDGIYAIILEHLRPLWRAFLHQTGDIGEAMIGVVALCQSADHALLS